MILAVPLALLAIAGLLGLASHLEQSRTRVLVRLTVRSNASPEAAEALIASELAPYLAAHGLAERPERPAA
jgi:hypothetical protein